MANSFYDPAKGILKPGHLDNQDLPGLFWCPYKKVDTSAIPYTCELLAWHIIPSNSNQSLQTSL